MQQNTNLKPAQTSNEENALTAIAQKEIAATHALISKGEEALRRANTQGKRDKAWPQFVRLCQIGNSRLRRARAEIARGAAAHSLINELPS